MQIIRNLERQRDAIDAAIRALKGGDARNGRKSNANKLTAATRGTRKFSAAARKKMSAAAKRRWAKAKKAGQNSL